VKVVFLLTLSSGLHILHCLELSSKIQIFPVKNFKKGKFCGIKLFMIQPRLMAMINEAKKQSKTKRKKIFWQVPENVDDVPKSSHFYLASLSEDQRALLHYCDRTSPAFTLPSSTSTMIAMP